MNKQKLIEEARKLVIMDCHPGMTYKEALKKEHGESCRMCGWTVNLSGRVFRLHPITIGKIIGSLEKKYNWYDLALMIVNFWKFQRKGGSEATLEDQTMETIREIIKLLKTNE